VVERHRWIFCGLLALGVSSVFVARSLRAGTSRHEEAEQWFQDLTVQAVSLDLSSAAMAKLAREPRTWVRASFRLGDDAAVTVGVRFKGHRSLRGWADKPAFKVDFARYEKGQRYRGLRAISLNNMVDDPTMLREHLAARVFEALSVPAPRVSYASVRVNGDHFGLYTVVEPPRESLLTRYFRDATGPVFEGEYGCDLYADDVWALEQDAGSNKDRTELARLAERMRTEPVSAWLLGDNASFDRDKVLSYLAVSNLLADFDGYRHAHNYQLYFDPSTQRWSFLPWGFDRLFSSPFPVYESQGRVAQACFADSVCRRQYSVRLHDFAERFERLGVERWIDRADNALAKRIEHDPRRPHSLKARARALSKLRRFVRERATQVRAQLGCVRGEQEIDTDNDGAGCMDCDDGDPTVHPGAPELCDGRDNDCSGQADDAASCGCPLVQLGAQHVRACSVHKSYWEAKQFCAELGGTLASVASRAQLQALRNALTPLDKADWWVGLDDLGREGKPLWADGTKPKRNMWLPGEPDNFACGQHCSVLAGGKRAGLRDQHCAATLPFVCTVSADSQAQSPTPR
jgi:hypothetical protein